MNNLTAHNFEKVNLLEAYNTVNKFNIICLNMNGYKMMRADHPNNTKREVWAYVRKSLPVRNFSNSYLSNY